MPATPRLTLDWSVARTSVGIFLCSCVLGVSGQTRLAHPPGTEGGSIRGLVVDATANAPLRGAIVQIVALGVGGRRTYTTTDNGVYTFQNVSVGDYQISVSKPGYVVTARPQRGQGRGLYRLHVNAGQTLTDLTLALSHGGALSGHVVDEFGDPVAGVAIAAERIRYTQGGAQLVSSGFSTTTDDLGFFRVYGLDSGSYYVAARLSEPASHELGSIAGYAQSYYPGTSDIGSAQALHVNAGDTLSDLVMPFAPIAVGSLEGTVRDANGRPMAGGVVDLRQRGTLAITTDTASIRSDGSFSIPNVPPGDYVVRAEPRRDAAASNVAAATVSVSGGAVTSVSLVAPAMAFLSGRVIAPDGVPSPTIQLGALTTTVGGEVASTQPQLVNRDLTFSMACPPGHAAFQLFRRPRGWSIRAVMISGIDATRGFAVAPGQTIRDIEVVMTNVITTVGGNVLAKDGAPLMYYTVVAFPQDENRWADPGSAEFRTAVPDASGTFSFTIMPGRYLLVAVDTLEPGEERSLEFLQRVRDASVPLSIREGDAASISLTLTHWDR